MAKQKTTRAEGIPDNVTVIKKYANRRLYNTATSTYVTLEYLSEMVKNGEEFLVFDAKSDEDITRSVLTQIIFEEEGKGEHMLPISFLRQLIGFYGDNLQSFVPSYLEASMEAFAKNQEAMRQNLSGSFGENPALKMFEDTARQNMAMFQQGMKMFGLNTTMPEGGVASPFSKARPGQAAEPTSSSTEEVEALRAQVAELTKKMATMEPKK